MTMRDATSAWPPATSLTDWWAQLSQLTLPVETIRQIDQLAIERYHMHSLVLMENAALACAAWLITHYRERPRALILCGRGNNGGDGLAIARQLKIAGWSVEVVALGPEAEMSPDARANWHILTARGLNGCQLIAQPQLAEPQGNITQIGPAEDASLGPDRSVARLVWGLIDRAELIIDAMLGSGARGTPRAPLADWIDRSNRRPCHRVAIDIPSGLDASTGEVAPVTFQADATLTFVARKPGFTAQAARACLGQVAVLPIGIPVELMAEVCLSNRPRGD